MENIHSAAPPAAGQSVRFAQVPLTILSDPRLSEIDKTVYAALAAHRNARHGKAWPKRKTLAGIVGCHVETVTKSTTKLVALGYLTKTDGRGRGCTTFYRFPLEDQRQAQRREALAQGKPTEAKASKPRAEEKPSRPAGFCAVSPYRGTEVLTQEPTTLPSYPAQAQADQEGPYAAAPRGESLAETPNLESIVAEVAVPAVEVAAQAVEIAPNHELPAPPIDKAPLEAPQAPTSTETPSTPTYPQPQPRLSFPSGLRGKALGIIARMLCGLPFEDAQMLLDEYAGNARRHTVHNPVGYMRKLLDIYRAGKLVPELADLEQHRRQHIQANERARQLAERRHLAALAQGQLPASPPIVIERTADAEAQARLALAQARLALKGALLSPEQREAARAAYLASKPAAPTPAPQPQGEEDAAGVAFFAEMRAKLGIRQDGSGYDPKVEVVMVGLGFVSEAGAATSHDRPG